MAENLRQYIWELKLRSEFNVLYWTSIGAKFHFRDRMFKFLIAFLSSGAVASWLLVDLPIAWQILSTLTAAASIFLSVMNWPGVIQRVSEVRSQWIEIAENTEKIYLKSQNHEEREYLESEIQAINTLITKVHKDEFLLPNDERLKEKCYNKIKSEYPEVKR